ncbi:MAG: 30S ribosomal protein S17 [bacterium]|nr:30S ribosomal protein S17 [bacterium]
MTEITKHIQKLRGTVVSTKMPKTVVISVTRLAKHPRIHKYVKITKRYKAHTEDTFEVGDYVTIQPSRPISKDKRWIVVKE